MNEEDQTDFNCHYCEYSIRIKPPLVKDKVRCPQCNKMVKDIHSKLIPLASAIESLPEIKNAEGEPIIDNLIQENRPSENHISENSFEKSQSKPLDNFKKTSELEFDQDFANKQEILAHEFAVSQSDMLNWEAGKDQGVTQLTSKAKSNIVIFILASLMIASLSVYISLKGISINSADVKNIQLKSESKSTQSGKPSIQKPLNFQDLERQMGAKALHSLATESLTKFLKSANLNTKIQFCRSPQRVRPLMKNYYSNKDSGPKEFRRISELGASNTGIIDKFYILKLSFPDFSILPVVLAWENEQILVDWESYVGYSEITLKDFILQKPKKSKLFRLNATSDNYFNFQFSENDYRCLYLRNSEDTEAVYGYIRRGNDADNQLSRIIESGESIKFLTLKLRYPEKLGGKNQVIIDEIVTPGWLIKE
ncbi:hypothetical protein N8603_04105 [Verrucomicrobiales bacterium]|nr:hypothetical protein [Verrucomicrobiales bacterium]